MDVAAAPAEGAVFAELSARQGMLDSDWTVRKTCRGGSGAGSDSRRSGDTGAGVRPCSVSQSV